MSGEERIEKRLTDIEGVVRATEVMVFGVRGEGGLVRELGGLRADFAQWRREERERHQLDNDKEVSSAKAMVLALGSTVVALLAIIVTLIGLVVT